MRPWTGAMPASLRGAAAGRSPTAEATRQGAPGQVIKPLTLHAVSDDLLVYGDPAA